MSGSELGLAACDRTDTLGAQPTTTTTTLFGNFDSPVAVRLVERAGLSRATVIGEIDLGTAPFVEDVLARCLARSPKVLDLDLGEVEFFDCAALNALLRLRQRALGRGAALTVSQTSPPVSRVLELTGTRPLFTAGNDHAGGSRWRIVRRARAGRR